MFKESLYKTSLQKDLTTTISQWYSMYALFILMYKIVICSNVNSLVGLDLFILSIPDVNYFKISYVSSLLSTCYICRSTPQPLYHSHKAPPKIQLQLSENVLLWNNRLWCGRRKPDPRGAFHSKYFICRCQQKAKVSSDISGRLCKVQFLHVIQQSKWKLVGETKWLTLNLEWFPFISLPAKDPFSVTECPCLAYFLHQDHTSQDHFCSVIDEFPVWNSEPDQPTMMSWATVPEREEVPELLLVEIGNIDHRSLLC